MARLRPVAHVNAGVPWRPSNTVQRPGLWAAISRQPQTGYALGLLRGFHDQRGDFVWMGDQRHVA
jgi:hypothetical protein